MAEGARRKLAKEEERGPQGMRRVLMRKQLLALACVTGLAGIIQFAGCGPRIFNSGPGSGFSGAPPTPLVVSGGDAPLCSILSFTVTITGMTLTAQTGQFGGGGAVSVLPAGNSVTLDFASLLDFTTVLSLSSLPAGTYSQLNVTLANPSINYLDTSKTPPVVATLTPTLSALTVPVTLNTPLTVSGSGIAGLTVDFNLLQSVLIDPKTGQLTGKVNPTFSASGLTSPGASGFAEFDDLRGIVQSITTTSTNTAYTGSFTLEPATGPALPVMVNSSTQFDGISGLGTLTKGTFVEVNALADANGNILANAIQVEEQEDASTGEAAFAGLITSVTYSSGQATKFNLFVGEENPDVSGQVPLRSILPVSITASTRFVTSALGAANFTSLVFGATTLGAGQRVVVHGQLNSGAAPTTATARSIFLGVQPVLGNVSSSAPVIYIGADGKAGGFYLAPCSPLFQPQPIAILTADSTTFVGITSLLDINSTTPFLVTKGLVLYDQAGGSWNGLVWRPPASVQAAGQVHQLPSP